MIKKIAHITDLHLDESFPFQNNTSARKRLAIVLNDIEKHNINHIICTGDIGVQEGISYFFQKIISKKIQITLGNHDTYQEITKYYQNGLCSKTQKIYKSKETTHFKYIYLDSSSGSIDKAQILWLAEELNTTKNILLFLHHPIIGLDLKVDKIGKLKNREQILNMLNNISNKISIFCGHYHMESTVIHKNITQYITPAVAFQIKKLPHTIEIDTTITGYRIIQLQNNHLSSSSKLLKVCKQKNNRL